MSVFYSVNYTSDMKGKKYLGLQTSLRRYIDDQFELIVAKIKEERLGLLEITY